ncbi:MAG: hypothetical protein R3D51_06965 [Hyphomicrobiaceae bacterium]
MRTANFLLISLFAAASLAGSLSAQQPTGDAVQTAPNAQREDAVDSMAGTDLSEDSCTGIWLEINPQNAPSLKEKDVKGVVTDFAKANADGDDSIDQTEFMSACKNKLVVAPNKKK